MLGRLIRLGETSDIFREQLNKSVMSYAPSCILIAEYALLSVDIVSFSLSVICFAIVLLIFVRRTSEIFSIVSAYCRVRRVNEFTHENSVILGAWTTWSMSFHV